MCFEIHMTDFSFRYREFITADDHCSEYNGVTDLPVRFL